MKGYNIQGDTIIINRELTEIDLFVKNFLEVLKKHCDYLIVSGFVSISTGRVRGTEDVDVLIEVLSKDLFNKLFSDLKSKGFWCYQGDESKEIYPYVENMQNIRFAKDGQIFPNMEMVFINQNKKAKYYEFTHPQKIRIMDFEFKIPPIEFEILYKELILAGKKDIEDARHLRVFFKDILKENKFKKYREIILGDKNG